VLPPKAIEPRDSDHKPTAECALYADDSFNAIIDGVNYTERRKNGSVMGERGWTEKKTSKSQEERSKWESKSEGVSLGRRDTKRGSCDESDSLHCGRRTRVSGK